VNNKYKLFGVLYPISRNKTICMIIDLNGTNIKRIRVYSLKLTQKEFAEQVGVSVPQVSRWENHTCKPTKKFIRKIIEVVKLKYTTMNNQNYN